MFLRVAAVCLYSLLLHRAYVVFTAPSFSYLGFRARDFASIDLAAYGATIVAVALLSQAMPRRLRRPSDFMLWCVYVLSVIPTVTVAHYADITTVENAIRLSVAVLGLFLMAIILVRGGPRFTLRVKAFPSVLAWGTIVAFSGATYGYLAVTTGLQIQVVGLADVQNVRFGYRDVVAAAGMLGYLLTLQSYVINPLVMARGIYRRRPIWFVLGALGQVLLYSAAGHKMSILSPLAVLLIALAYRRRPRLTGSTILYGIFGVALASIAIDEVRGNGDLTAIFVQRLLLIPGALAAAFFDIFSGAPKANFAHTAFIGAFTESPYQSTPAFHVGTVFHGNPEVSANANFFADGFANAGLAGMFIETLVFVGILWLLDATLTHLPMPVVASMLALPALALCNVSAFTAILSQGMAMAMLLGLVLPRTGWSRSRPHKAVGRHQPATAPRVRRLSSHDRM